MKRWMGAVRLNHERYYFHPSEFPAVAAAMFSAEGKLVFDLSVQFV